MKQIGIIGAGIMANGMVQNFLKHGYVVHIWNRTQDHAQPLLKAGAVWCESPRTVAQAADIVIECVSDDEASRRVWTDEGAGILAGADSAMVLIASSSLSLAWTDELGALCEERKFDFLDMPLTGSRAGAEGGMLKLLVGGDRAVLDGIREELGAISEKIFYFGTAGSGMRFKLMLNSLIGIHTNAAAQAALIAKKAGIDPTVFREALFEGGMGPASPATGNAIKFVESPGDALNFSGEWLEKDLRYAQAMTQQYGLTFNLLNTTREDYARMLTAGLGKADITHIAELFT